MLAAKAPHPVSLLDDGDVESNPGPGLTGSAVHSKKAAAASKAFEETTMLSARTQAASSWKIWG